MKQSKMTMKAMKASRDIVVGVPHAFMDAVLAHESAIGYATGVDGWNCDLYHVGAYGITMGYKADRASTVDVLRDAELLVALDKLERDIKAAPSMPASTRRKLLLEVLDKRFEGDSTADTADTNPVSPVETVEAVSPAPTSAVVNIGLVASPEFVHEFESDKIKPIEVLKVIDKLELGLQAYTLRMSNSERTLIAQLDNTTPAKMLELSRALAQDCIAVLPDDGAGYLAGDYKDKWGEFKESYFIRIS